MGLDFGNARVTVYTPNIAGMFTPGGEVNQEATKITVEVEAAAITRASKFSPSPQVAAGSRIISSHIRRVVPSGSLFGTRGYVENTSGHAIYKHEGSPGATSERVMQIRRGKWGPRKTYHVSGYEGEPWLAEAANEVLSRYGVRFPLD